MISEAARPCPVPEAPTSLISLPVATLAPPHDRQNSTQPRARDEFTAPPASHGAKSLATLHQHAKTRHPKYLRWTLSSSRSVPRIHIRPVRTSSGRPSLCLAFPTWTTAHLPPLLAQKLFLSTLFAGRQAPLGVAEERDAEAETARQGPAVRRKRRRNVRACASRYRGRRREAEEEYVHLIEKNQCKAQEAHRLAVEQEEHRVEEEESREKERHECERENSFVTENLQLDLADRLLAYKVT